MIHVYIACVMLAIMVMWEVPYNTLFCQKILCGFWRPVHFWWPNRSS